MEKENVKKIIKGYICSKNMTIGEYCKKEEITRRNFDKCRRLYIKYYPYDETTIENVSIKAKQEMRRRKILKEEVKKIDKIIENTKKTLLLYEDILALRRKNLKILIDK